MKQKILLLHLLVLSALLSHAKGEKDWEHRGQVNFGATVNFNYGRGQKFPGVKVYCGFGISNVFRENFIVDYGSSITLYTKSVGSNLNPMIYDMQIDFINSISIGGGYDRLSYTKYFRTITNGYYYNISIDHAYAGLLSTNFILNSHKRNQIVGAASLSFPSFTVNYYNDGAWGPLPIGDNFDRYWTGGGGLFFHNKKGYNDVEVTFDQFTGYSSLLYELSNALGINVPDYNTDQYHKKGDEIKNPPSYNTSAYNVKYFPMKGYAIDVGVMGALRDRNGSPYGVQDIIHTLRKYALHPNYDGNKFYIGGSYLNKDKVEL